MSWPVVRLGERLDFLTSGSRGWSRYTRDTGAMFLRIQNVGRNELLLDDVAFVEAPSGAEADRTRVRTGDLLLSITADLGRTAVVPEGLGAAHINQHLAILRLRDFDPRFVSAFISLGPGQRQLLKLDRGGVKSGLNFDDVRSLNVPCPPLAEQRRIADVLDKADAVRRKRKESIALTEQLLRSTFLEMFGDPVTNPRGWEVRALGDVLARPLQNGAYFPKERYSAQGDGTGVEMVHMSDAFSGIVERGALRRVAIDRREQDLYRLGPDDILVARRSLNYEGSAKPCRIPDTRESLIFESSLIRVTPDGRRVTPLYLFAYLSNERARRQYVLPNVTQSTISGINQAGLERVSVLVPPIESQRDFADAWARTEVLRGYYQHASDISSSLCSSLVDRAFSGRL